MGAPPPPQPSPTSFPALLLLHLQHWGQRAQRGSYWEREMKRWEPPVGRGAALHWGGWAQHPPQPPPHDPSSSDPKWLKWEEGRGAGGTASPPTAPQPILCPRMAEMGGKGGLLDPPLLR